MLDEAARALQRTRATPLNRFEQVIIDELQSTQKAASTKER